MIDFLHDQHDPLRCGKGRTETRIKHEDQMIDLTEEAIEYKEESERRKL